MLNFNSAARETGDLIPDGTIAPVHLTVRPGGAGEGGWLKRSKAGNVMMLDCEFTVIEGQFAKRKFWTLLTVEGETDGQKKAAEISASRLRSILESARGVKPFDDGPDAEAARQVDGWGDFDSLRFWVKIGIEKGKDGYQDKNIVREVITPDRAKLWSKLGEAGTKTATQPAPVANSGRPSWAA